MRGGGVVAEFRAGVATGFAAAIAIIAAGAVLAPRLALTLGAGARLGTRVGWTTARKGLAGENISAIPAGSDGVKIGRWGERDRGGRHRGLRVCGRGGGGRLFALAVLGERLARENQRLGGWTGVGVGIGVEDWAGAAGLAAVDAIAVA